MYIIKEKKVLRLIVPFEIKLFILVNDLTLKADRSKTYRMATSDPISAIVRGNFLP